MNEERTLASSLLKNEQIDKKLLGANDTLHVTARMGHVKEEIWAIEGRKKQYSSVDEALDHVPNSVKIRPTVVYNSPDDWTITLGDETYTAQDGISFQGVLNHLQAQTVVEGYQHCNVKSYGTKIHFEKPHMYEMCGKGGMSLLSFLETREKIVDLEDFYSLRVICMVGIGKERTKDGKISTFWKMQNVTKQPTSYDFKEEYEPPKWRAVWPPQEEPEKKEKKKRRKRKKKVFYNMDLKMNKFRIDLTEMEYAICQETCIAILGMQDEDTIETIFPIRTSAIRSLAATFKVNEKGLSRIIKANPLGVSFMLEGLLSQFEADNEHINIICRNASRRVVSVLGMEAGGCLLTSQRKEIMDALDFLRGKACLPDKWTVTSESVSVLVHLPRDCADYTIFVNLYITDYPKRSVAVSAYAKFGRARVNISEFNSEINKKGIVSSLLNLLQSNLMDTIAQFQMDYEKMHYCTAVFNRKGLRERFAPIISIEKMRVVFEHLRDAYENDRAYASTDLYIDVINQIFLVASPSQRVTLRTTTFPNWLKQIVYPRNTKAKNREATTAEKTAAKPITLDFSNGEIKFSL